VTGDQNVSVNAFFRQRIGLTSPASVAVAQIGSFALLTFAMRSASAVIALVGAVQAVAVSGLTVLSAARRARQIRLLTMAIERVSAGELKSELPQTGDPVTDTLSHAVADLVARLRETVSALASGARQIRVSYQELQSVSTTMSTTAELAADRATAVAVSAEQVAASVHRVAAATEEFTATIGEVAQHAEHAAGVAQGATQEAAKAQSRVRELGEASEQVTRIVDLIANIARQTHLLALNATLEAARAGEAGRGFAVVAGSVKQLAEQTAAATEDVGSTVRGIQAGSGSAGFAIDGIVSTIRTVNDNQAAIASAVEQQTATTNEIGRGASEAAGGAAQIAGHIAGLVDLATDSAYAGAQARTTAADFAHLAALFDSLTERFDAATLLSESASAHERAATSATTDGRVTRIEDTVRGAGLHQFDFVGEWRFSSGNVEADGTNTYSCHRGDVATLRFTGARAAFYGVTDANHGIVAISVDGGEESLVDEYSPTRASGVLLWRSADLPRGEHTVRIRVTGERGPHSRFSWAAVDRVEVS
jgi:methyl-accepting chemotaxis protein